MSATKPDEPSKSQNLSPSAQILSNVEMLVAMCEEQERAAAAASEPADTSVIEAAVEKSARAAVDDAVAKAIQAAISDTLSSSIEKALEDCFSRFDKRIAEMDDRINHIDDQQNKIDSNLLAFSGRFDSLDEKLDSAPPSSALGSGETESQFGSQLDMIGSNLTEVISKFESKFASLEKTFQDQCKTVDGFDEKLNAEGGTKPDASTEQITETEETKPVDDDSVSGWQEQKQAMLAKYGGDSEPQSLDDASTEADSEKAVAQQSNDSNEQATATDSAEIEKLKAELNSKLREVEVELSINRARLSQERAEFERNQADLDRRASKLDARLAAMNSDGDDDSDGDLMSRFKRHLGG